MNNTIDQLSRRMLLAGEPFATLADGTLTVSGTDRADAILVEAAGSWVVARRNGASLSFLAQQVQRVAINGRGGNDSLESRLTLPTTLSGNAGNDKLLDSPGVDSLDGGSGDDEIFPLAGDNTIVQAGGSDRVDYERCGSGIFNLFHEFESPILKIRTSQHFNDFILDPTGATIRITSKGDFVGVAVDFEITVDCGGGDDTIGAGAQDNATKRSLATVLAGNGNDVIRHDEDRPIALLSAGLGNDVLEDEDGQVNFNGGPGYDTVFYGDEGGTFVTIPPGVEEAHAPAVSENSANVTGNELDNKIFADFVDGATILGLGGNDTIYGSSLGDFLIGGDGNDVIFAAGGVDTVDGGTGNDNIFGGDGNDRINGDAGNDQIQGESGRDTLNGNSGNDNLHGGSGDDRLFGGSGNDTIDGGGGRDLLDGQAGNDILYARDSLVDTIIGGGGFDRARRDNSSVARDIVDGVEAFI